MNWAGSILLQCDCCKEMQAAERSNPSAGAAGLGVQCCIYRDQAQLVITQGLDLTSNEEARGVAMSSACKRQSWLSPQHDLLDLTT